VQMGEGSPERVSTPAGAVFLSYASQDAEAARRICDALRAAGIEVWFDQSELRGGDAWDHKIRKQIHDCTIFIPVVSATTQGRTEGYFRLEWKLAVERTHLMSERVAFLVPVVIDDTSDAQADVPQAFRAFQWTRLPAGVASPAFVARISQLLSPNPPQAPTDGRLSTGLAPSSRRPTSSVAASRRSKLVPLLIAVVALLVVGYFALDKFVLSKRTLASAIASLPGRSEANPISERSIAVLPFVDMSEKHDQEYFSDGLSEEVLELLAKTPGLHVIARTSSFSFKAKSDDIPTIAKKLNVANILEGSVRKSGNRLRVTTQLIRASSAEHLWSETYDRDLKDVFAVQDEIAAAVHTRHPYRRPTTNSSSAGTCFSGVRRRASQRLSLPSEPRRCWTRDSQPPTPISRLLKPLPLRVAATTTAFSGREYRSRKPTRSRRTYRRCITREANCATQHSTSPGPGRTSREQLAWLPVTV